MLEMKAVPSERAVGLQRECFCSYKHFSCEQNNAPVRMGWGPLEQWCVQVVSQVFIVLTWAADW